MELVYLWVEKYKNIKQQGFNFSPRFDCKFDGENLTIEKKEYTSIFPKNINITAIVGENGSGKSSIFELFYHYFKSDVSQNTLYSLDIINKNLSDEFILIFFDGIRYKAINRTKKITIVNDFDDLNLSEVSFFSNENFGINSYLPFYKNENFYDNNRFISNIINFIKNEKSFYKTDFFKPTSIYLNINNSTGNTLIEKIASQIKIEYKKAEKQLKDKPEVIKVAVKNDIKKLIKNQYLLESLFSITDDKTLYLFQNKENINEKSIIECIEFLDKFGLIEIYDNSKSHYSNYGFDVGLNFNQLSNGEKDNIKLFLDIYFYLKSNTGISQLVLLDEPTNAQHPSWQKHFIKDLISFTSSYISKETYFYITTHSPFIISDLQKENIIFLEKDKINRQCINSSNKIDIKPFGANIHTLLSHGFFMEDGLMGEFAKEKIGKIKIFYDKVQTSKNPKEEYLKEYNENIEEFINIQKIIGEPFLKTIMGNYLDELHLLFSNDENLIQKELDELEKRKAYLESLKK